MRRPVALSMLGVATMVAVLAAAEDEPRLPAQRTYVLVHGAWGGGWAWRDVADRLRARGHEAYRPTLTGLGERRHLVAEDVGLDTHIEDVVQLLLFEQLQDVVLVGHSYGGMVISGVADRVPERIAHRVYIDAFVPEDGESVAGEDGPDEWLRNQTREGLVIPPWVQPDQQLPHDVPHPLRSLTDRVRLENEAAKRIPTTYILTVDPGAETDDFSGHAARARARGWAFEQLEADHNPQWSKPAELTDLLDAAPEAAATEARAEEAFPTMHAAGTFEVKLAPLATYNQSPDAKVGRMSIDKTFQGDLEATSQGEMLSGGSPAEGSAGYVAIERVTGTLHGLRGSFLLQHSGTMTPASQEATITVVPGSGAGELEGIAGSMSIEIEEGRHSYELVYTLADRR